MVKFGFHVVFDSHHKAGLSGAEFIEQLPTCKASIHYPNAFLRNHTVEHFGKTSVMSLPKMNQTCRWITLRQVDAIEQFNLVVFLLPKQFTRQANYRRINGDKHLCRCRVPSLQLFEQFHIDATKVLPLPILAGFGKGRNIDLNSGMIQSIKQVPHARQTGVKYEGQPDFKKQARVQNRVVIC
jgi:hypothetical protein